MSSNKDIDELLVQQLSLSGIDIEGDIGSLDKFVVYKVSSTLVRNIFESMKNIDHPTFPEALPKEMSACYKVCSTLANAIKDLGYKRDLGFEQLLYPKERDTREIFSFLVERNQPKDEDKDSSLSLRPTSSKSGLAVSSGRRDVELSPAEDPRERIAKALQSLLKSTLWTQRTPVLKPLLPPRNLETIRLGAEYILQPVSTSPKSFDKQTAEMERRYLHQYLAPLTKQASLEKQLSPSIFEDHLNSIVENQVIEDEWSKNGMDSGLSREEFFRKKQEQIAAYVKGALRNASLRKEQSAANMSDVLKSLLATSVDESGFSRRKKFEREPQQSDQILQQIQEKENPEDIEKKRQDELQTLTDAVDKLKVAQEDMNNEIMSMSAGIRQLEETIQEEKQKKASLEQNLKILASTVLLLENKEENLKKMEALISSTGQHLIQLGQEWEKHRVPLFEKYRAIKHSQMNAKNLYRDRLDETRRNQKQLEEFVSEIRMKEDRLGKLKEEFNQLPKDVERRAYVDRIMDVIKNVDKQKKEISRILMDNKALQRDINKLSESLSRIFKLLEESVYADVAKEEQSKVLYKNVVEMRNGFNTMIDVVQQTGTMSNQIRDLEVQIESLMERKDNANIEKLQKDLAEIKAENQTLVQELKR